MKPATNFGVHRQHQNSREIHSAVPAFK